MTIRDIADHAGTSFKTVSRVINRQAGVSEELRERVVQSMQQLGYRPDRAAQTLRSGRNYSICILTALTAREAHNLRETPEFISSIMAGALQACRKEGFQLVFDTIPDPSEQGDDAVDRLQGMRSDGVILFPPHADKIWLLDHLDALEIPYVRIAPGIQIERSDCFLIDEYAAGRELGGIVVELGHRSIGCLSGPEEHIAARQRVAGFKSALEGIGGIRLREAEGDFLFEAGLGFGKDVLAAPGRPTAIFAANDLMALGVMAAARDLGLHLPSELSVAGFDDIAGCWFVRPALTTVSQDVRAMGHAATAQLISTIMNKKPPAPRIATLPYQLKIRESLAQPSQ